MDQLIKKIENAGWAERTVKARISLVKSLKEKLDPSGNSIDCLKDFNKVSKSLLDSTSNPSSRKTKILTIKSILALVDVKASMKYENLVHTLIDSNDEYKGNNLVKDKDKWITFDEVKLIPSGLAEDIVYIYKKLFLDNDEIDALKSKWAKFKYLRLLTEFMITVVYCWLPPVRADWAVVSLNTSKTVNYYDHRKGLINWNDFKNIKSFGKRSFRLKDQYKIVENDIQDLMDEYIGVLEYLVPNPKWLFYLVGRDTITEFNRERFAIYFTRIMKNTTGKALTINTFRHVFEQHIITDKDYHSMTINQKKEIHEQLLHKIGTAQEYLVVDG